MYGDRLCLFRDSKVRSPLEEKSKYAERQAKLPRRKGEQGMDFGIACTAPDLHFRGLLQRLVRPIQCDGVVDCSGTSRPATKTT